MRIYNLRLVSFLLVVALFAAGCTASNNPQSNPTATLVPTIAPVATDAPDQAAATAAGDAVAATPVPGTTQAVPETGANNGGLVIAIDPANSEARYRVREQLAGRDLPNDAVGRTKAVSGQAVVNPDGSIDAAGSQFTVDLSTLQSDAGMRDNYLRGNVLQTSQYPNATFVPKTVSGLTWPLPQSGPVSFQLTGDLTIRDVTKSVTWDVTGEIQDSQAGRATGTATTSFTFGEFNLQQPRVRSVLSIDDKITLEVDVALQASGQ